MTKTALKAKIMAEFDDKFLRKKICKACLLEKCDYSTTGCPWYQDNLVLNSEGGEINTAEQMRAFISSSIDLAIETAFRETEVEKKEENEIGQEYCKKCGGKGCDECSYHGAVHSQMPLESNISFNQAVAEKSAKEAEFINS